MLGGFGYDPSTRTLGLGMTGVDGLGLEAFRASVVLVAQGLDDGAPVARALATDGEGRHELVPRDGEDRGARRAPASAAAANGSGAGRASAAVGRRARRLQNTLNRAAAGASRRAEKLGDGGASRHYAAAVERESAALASGAFEKHWTIIVEAERLARRLDLPLAVFCKSGKDRTGMAATLAAAAFCFGRDVGCREHKSDGGGASPPLRIMLAPPRPAPASDMPAMPCSMAHGVGRLRGSVKGRGASLSPRSPTPTPV